MCGGCRSSDHDADRFPRRTENFGRCSPFAAPKEFSPQQLMCVVARSMFPQWSNERDGELQSLHVNKEFKRKFDDG
jgi:hypothetical protein